MRDYGKIATSIWRSQKFRGLADDEHRLFYLYLHTCPHVNSAGCFVLPLGYIEADLGWSKEVVLEALESLSQSLLIAFDKHESVVRIVDFLRHESFTNKNHAMGAVRIALQLPNCREKLNVLKELSENRFAVKDEISGQIESLSKAFPKPLCPEPEPEPEPKTLSLISDEQEHQGDKTESEFEAWWKLTPRKVGKGQARRAFKSARKKVSLETLNAGIGAFAESVAGKEQQFIAHPATWLNGERWLDEGQAQQSTTPANGHADTGPSVEERYPRQIDQKLYRAAASWLQRGGKPEDWHESIYGPLSDVPKAIVDDARAIDRQHETQGSQKATALKPEEATAESDHA